MHEHHSKSDQPLDPKRIAKGFEESDVRVSGIVVFLTALLIFVIVSAFLCIGIGKVINSQIAKADGPPNRWAHPVEVRKLGNLANSPELQQQFSALVQSFPPPQLQTDDGFQEIADLHTKEDLLLDNYTWVDQQKGVVRIPIDRAMELTAQRGLPVAQFQTTAPLLAHDAKPTVQVPLTTGFARTGYEQDERAKMAEMKGGMQ
jgi:hypothetical protein